MLNILLEINHSYNKFLRQMVLELSNAEYFDK